MFSRLCCSRVKHMPVRLCHVWSRNATIQVSIKPPTVIRLSLPHSSVVLCRGFSSGDRTSSEGDSELFAPTSTYDSVSSPTSDVPDVAQTVSEVISQTDTVASAASLGGYTPVGLIQTALELIHTHTHLPWWASIALATVGVRLALVPLAVKMQINAIKIANINPIAAVINRRMAEYKAAGNTIGMAMEGKKLLELYQIHNCHPIKSILMPLFQIPIFVSFFFALRQMATLPLESMKTGGMLWFTDLTIADPTYILPLMACVSFIGNVELGAEGGAPTDNEMSRKVKMFMRLSAVLVLPITIKFKAAMFMYWVTNSLFSTAQILIFRIPVVKKALGIPKLNRPVQTNR